MRGFAEEHHDELEMVRVGDVLYHDVEVCAVEEKLGEQLERGPLCEVLRRLEEVVVEREKLLKVFSPSGMTTITYIAGQGRVCNNLNH